jgi:hypothetical protein
MQQDDNINEENPEQADPFEAELRELASSRGG